MLDFAKDKKFWENVRVSDDFAQHRAELFALYEEAFKQRPRAHSAKEILENNDHFLWRKQFDHLQSSALLSLIYPENEQYYDDLIDTVWAYLDDYAWAPLGHYSEHYYGKTPKDFDNGLIDIFASSVGFALCEVKNLKYECKIVGSDVIYNLFTMTPYYHRTSLEDKKKLEGVCEIDTTVEVNFFIYKKL